MSKRPNILFIMTDQEPTTTSGCYGNKVIRTPVRDSLAENGMRFDNNYVAAYPCTPSRATQITGLWVHDHGLVTNGIVLDQKHPTLGSLLSEAGYDTTWIGKSHMGGWFEPHSEETCPYHELEMTDMGYRWKKHPGGAGGEDYVLNGFQTWVSGWSDYRAYLQTTDLPDEIKQDRWVGGHQVMQSGPDSEHVYSRLTAEHHMAHWMADEAVKAVDAAKDSENPFLMVLSFYAPHHPVAPPRPYDTMYDLDDIELPESFDAPQALKNTPPGNSHNLTNTAGVNWTKDQCRDYLRRYYGYVSYLDDQMARVMNALKSSGQHDDTIVVFTSDHGDMMCEQGLIYKHTFNGYDALMNVPLIVQWPGHIKPGSVHEGLASHIDLLPTLLELAGRDIPEGLDGKSMADVLTGDADMARDRVFCDVNNNGLMMREGRWKFVLNAALSDGEFVRKIDELYDLESDPHEITNLALEPEHQERVEAMRQRIFEWLDEVEYPYAHLIREAAALPMPAQV